MQGKLTRDDNAGAVGSAALSVASLFFIAIMIIAFTANPIAIGTDVGERAPDVEGKAYNGTSWVEFDFESYFDTSWEEGNMSGQWVALNSWILIVRIVSKLLMNMQIGQIHTALIILTGMDHMSTFSQCN